MNLDKVVCNCMNVTSGQIKEAVENGADTLEEVQQITGASTVCGACLGDVERLVNFFLAQRGKESQ
ncbi:(2Fe-2S)-binding protein [bacterium D16-50]|nr:(2Fe-2S)-binding protein [bacterium D16-50]